MTILVNKDIYSYDNYFFQVVEQSNQENIITLFFIYIIDINMIERITLLRHSIVISIRTVVKTQTYIQ